MLLALKCGAVFGCVCLRFSVVSNLTQDVDLFSLCVYLFTVQAVDLFLCFYYLGILPRDSDRKRFYKTIM